MGIIHGHSTYMKYLVFSEHFGPCLPPGGAGTPSVYRGHLMQLHGRCQKRKTKSLSTGAREGKEIKTKTGVKKRKKGYDDHTQIRPCFAAAWMSRACKAAGPPGAGSLVFCAAVSWLLMWVSPGTTQLISKEESRGTTGNHSEILGCRACSEPILFVFLTLGKRSVSYRGWFGPGRTGYGDFIMNFRLWFYQRTNNSPGKQHFITGGYRWEGVTVSTLFFRKCKPKKERGLILRPQNAWLKSNWGVLPQALSMPTGDCSGQQRSRRFQRTAAADSVTSWITI